MVRYLTYFEVIYAGMVVHTYWARVVGVGVGAGTGAGAESNVECVGAAWINTYIVRAFRPLVCLLSRYGKSP